MTNDYHLLPAGASPGGAPGASRRPARAHRLRARALYGVWVGWLGLACVTVGIFAFAAPLRYAQLAQACGAQGCAARAAYLVSLDSLTALVWLALALLVFWRRPGDRVGLFTSLTLLTFGVARFPDTPLALSAAHPEWSLPVDALRFLGSACLSIFVFVFPDGHFTPRGVRWIAAAWITAQIPEFFFASSAASSNTWPPLVRFAGFLGFVLCTVAAQIWRYQRVSTESQRIQTRWAVLGLSSGLVCYLALTFGYPLIENADPSPAALSPTVLTTLASLTFLLVPLSLAIAILRNRLYDVDILINRALVYGSLTALLALLYFGSTLALQFAALAITKRQQPSALVIVVSTLLIASVVQPLRRVLQQSIDRRFYRRRYDARATINAFAAPLRHEIDLADLREQLLEVIQETMQPTHVSLWLRPPDQREPKT